MAMRSYNQFFLQTPKWLMVGVLAGLVAAGAAAAQDPVPQAMPPRPILLPPPSGAITLGEVRQSDLRTTIKELVSCGTRHSLSSWTDPARGIGCGRDHIVAEFKKIAADSGGRLRGGPF